MFEVFQRTKERFVPTSFVSINPQGIFRFNMKCVRQYIQNKQFVDVYYDAELKRIGFQFAKDPGSHSMKICKAREGHFLHGKSILEKLNINIQETTKFTTKEDSNIVYFSWNEKDCLN